jgi:hydrogenase expression/formation protein HypE
MAHGGGGSFTARLIAEIFRPLFESPELDVQHDSAQIRVPAPRVAYSTDSYVVRPPVFPGGDIGSLAVTGSCNDVAMSGARPVFLSCAWILEEGLATEDLVRFAESAARAAREIGARIACGDTKVVERGHGDGVYVTTSALGLIEHELDVAPRSVREGDAVLLSGDVGRHGVAVMACREGLEFDARIESDAAHLWPLVDALLRCGARVHCLRDLTRGGLATALIEIAETAGVLVELDEAAVPVSDAVRGACEMLGLDPLYVVNEGRMIAFVPDEDADRALRALRALPAGAGGVRAGTVRAGTGGSGGVVHLVTPYGARRPLDRLSGEQLPRIC